MSDSKDKRMIIGQKNKVYLNSEIFEAGYSFETVGIYCMLAAYNGKISPDNLMKMCGYNNPDDNIAICKYALWTLFKDGFIELNILINEGAQNDQ